MDMMLLNVHEAPTHAGPMAAAMVLWFGFWLPVLVVRYRRLMAVLRAGR